MLLAAPVRVDPDRPRTGTVEMALAFAGAQPGEGRHSPCRAPGRGRRRTSRPSPATCPPAACEPGGQGGEHRARGTGPSERQRSRARATPPAQRADRTTRSHCQARSRRTTRAPATTGARAGMGRSPVPDTGGQLAHGAMPFARNRADSRRRRSSPALSPARASCLARPRLRVARNAGPESPAARPTVHSRSSRRYRRATLADSHESDRHDCCSAAPTPATRPREPFCPRPVRSPTSALATGRS